MSEVVPLPSFGEVFFDERGQERVLRVTWHEGTLVLSLWRGEMCTASFRMPMNDVGRLVDTLDQGFVEAGGQYPDEVGEPVHQADHAGYQDHGEFPGTGQYARPRPEDYASPQQYPDPAATQVVSAEEPRPVAALSPTDVLVARGAVPPPDRSQERPVAGYGPADVVPRENMIVNDSLSYGQPQPAEPLGLGAGEPAYQMPGDLYASQQPDPYGVSPQQPDPFAPQGHRPDPYGTPQQPDPYGAPSRQPDPYGAPSAQPDPYAPQGQQPDPYGAPSAQPDPYAPQGHRPDPYGVPPQAQQPDPYGVPSQQPADPYATQAVRQRPVDPFTPHADQFPTSGHPAGPDPYASPGHSTDPSGFPAQQSPYTTGQPDSYGYPAPAQPDPYAFGGQQAGHPADLRDLYGSPPAYQEQDVDPSDPLGIFGGQQSDQRRSRSRAQDPSHSTGERLRPERHRDDREERRDW
ncbi:hypothetical protein AB0395_18130 [Streptosporangium sp. NPDC051023]|uniref:hypothetical protein n=1 Tax=Streptosporangium sp. NPDC051023 TaxID=3155410 RepID=UPI0034508022